MQTEAAKHSPVVLAFFETPPGDGASGLRAINALLAQKFAVVVLTLLASKVFYVACVATIACEPVGFLELVLHNFLNRFDYEQR